MNWIKTLQDENYHILKTYQLFTAILVILLSWCPGNPTIPERPVQDISLSDYVNPFIGTSTNIGKVFVSNDLGKTYPGAANPFGLVQVSTNTITGGENGSGYSFEHKTIEGFAFTQMSVFGGYGDFGNFLVMPTNGPLKTNSWKENNDILGYRSTYDKESELVKVGYYKEEDIRAIMRVYGIGTFHKL